MHRWILYKIPVVVYCIILIWMFSVHPASALIVAGISLIIAIPWVIFAKWVCKRIDRSLKFNGRK